MIAVPSTGWLWNGDCVPALRVAPVYVGVPEMSWTEGLDAPRKTFGDISAIHTVRGPPDRDNILGADGRRTNSCPRHWPGRDDTVW